MIFYHSKYFGVQFLWTKTFFYVIAIQKTKWTLTHYYHIIYIFYLNFTSLPQEFKWRLHVGVIFNALRIVTQSFFAFTIITSLWTLEPIIILNFPQLGFCLMFFHDRIQVMLFYFFCQEYQKNNVFFSLYSLRWWTVLIYLVTNNVNLDHWIKVASVIFLQVKLLMYHFIINKHFVDRYFETI